MSAEAFRFCFPQDICGVPLESKAALKDLVALFWRWSIHVLVGNVRSTSQEKARARVRTKTEKARVRKKSASQEKQKARVRKRDTSKEK
ncbi:unnamed protein product [Symbiodinium pilosum]|uniref:Uncharacterized protein n=1 Tax=Symbiodinium pilosum TaxID=2952 RepID=A0A812JVE5_SYMPI|nr:unnamed protein product [Symbiodinium pilosum]